MAAANDLYAQLSAAWAELTAPGAQFEWQTVTVRGTPIRSYVQAPPSLREVWLASGEYAERTYLVYQDERWTYAQAHAEVAGIANWLQQRGVTPGDRVAIAMRNYPEWMLIYWACASIGATVVGMNAWWVGPEMVYGLQDAQPKVLFADAERLERLAPHQAEIEPLGITSVAVRTEAPGASAYQQVATHGGALPTCEVDTDSDACVFYTSGTTGRPKGAQLTHRGCVANIMNMAFWAAANLSVADRRGLPLPDPEQAPQPTALVTTPLFHVTANNCVAHGMTLNGGKLVHMYRWDAGVALELIARERVTAMTGVPVMARELIAHPDFADTDTSSLASLGGGGAQLQPDLVGKIDTSVATARPNTGYGMTETCGIITSISGDFFVDKPASAGPAMPVYETRIVDANDQPVATGERGELLVRGAPVIRGYLNRPEATADTIQDGWLRTGDIAYEDADGFLFIVDRAKDMVLRGGENVYCAEVESVLFEHPDVAECAVFGVPDDRLGEEVAAAVRVNTGASVSADALRAHMAPRIAKHKIPRYLWLLDEALPRNASGKFLKRELRETLALADAG